MRIQHNAPHQPFTDESLQTFDVLSNKCSSAGVLNPHHVFSPKFSLLGDVCAADGVDGCRKVGDDPSVCSDSISASADPESDSVLNRGLKY